MAWLDFLGWATVALLAGYLRRKHMQRRRAVVVAQEAALREKLSRTPSSPEIVALAPCIHRVRQDYLAQLHHYPRDQRLKAALVAAASQRIRGRAYFHEVLPPSGELRPEQEEAAA